MGDLNKYTLLVVDDEEVLRNAIAFDFERKGFKVFSAENGTQALALIEAEPIDLVISDLRMPGGDGVGLLEKTRERHTAKPIIFLVTGYTDRSDAELMEKGAQKVFQKPFDRKILMRMVYEALGIDLSISE